MMKRAIILLAFCGTCAIAAPGLSAPLAGIARDNHNQLRLVYGVAGNFILRTAVESEALAWAFDGSGGLVKTASELLVLDASGTITRRHPAPAGRALVGPASAFFPETGELWRVSADNDRTIAVQPSVIGGNIIALGPASGNSIELAVCRAGRLWLIEFDITSGAPAREIAPAGAIAQEACNAARPSSLLVLDGRLLLATAHELLVATTSGEERRIPLAGSSGTPPEIRQAARQWVEIEHAGALLVVRVTGDRLGIWQLPAAGERQ